MANIPQSKRPMLALTVSLLTLLTLAIYLTYTDARRVPFPRAVQIVKSGQSRTEVRSPKRVADIKPAALPKAVISTTSTTIHVEEAVDIGREFLEGVHDLQAAPIEKLDRNIAIADELIQQNPDIYAAYKGKLLSLLMKELKYKQDIDPAQYDDLYEILLQFRGEGERDEVLAELSGQSFELEGIDQDLIQIPFLRLKALGDIDSLAQMSQEYIEVYPESYIGYMYRAEASWSVGDKATAIQIFKQGFGGQMSDEAAFEIMNQIEAKSALERLAEMRLE